MIEPLKLRVRRLVGDGAYRSLAEMKVMLRHRVRWILGLDPRVRPQRPPTLRIERCGDWFLCPDLLEPDSIVYSIGIGRDLSFDLSLTDKFGVRVFAFDPTPEAVAWVRAQQLPTSILVRGIGVAAFDGLADFSPNTEAGNPSFSFVVGGSGRETRCEVRRLSTLMAGEGHSRIDLLKMDIEGAEYEVLEDIFRTAIPIRQLLVEFHHRKLSGGSRLTRRAVERLQAHGLRLVHVSPGGQEFLFVSQSELPSE